MNLVPSIPQDRSLWSVDLTRAAAAGSVLVYHYGVGGLLANATHLPAFVALSWPGAAVAVPLFFALSGFCIHGAEFARLDAAAGASFPRGFLVGYYQRRFRRIYPAYLLSLLLSWTIAILQGERIPPRDMGAHLVLAQGFFAEYFNSINLVLWTISVEACFYLIYPAWLWTRRRYGLSRALGFGVGLSAGSCLLTACLFFPFSFPARWFFLNTWFGWLAGAWLAEAWAREPRLFRRTCWWAFGVAVMVIYCIAAQHGAFHGRGEVLEVGALVLLCLWPLTGMLLLEARWRDGFGRSWLQRACSILRQIGLASYSLYLLHMPLMALRNYLHRDLPASALRTGVFIGWFFVILCLSWLSYRFVEKVFMRARSPAGG